MNTYLGPPDALCADQETNFTTDSFRGDCRENIIANSQVECPTTMSHVERYHGLLRTAFEKIQNTENTNDEEALEIAVKAINYSVNPEWLIPTLLIF
jgi:hypothetical protein